MKIGVLGSGDVGKRLSSGFAARGHEVQLGTRDPAKLSLEVPVATFADVAAWAEILVLCVHGEAGPEVLGSVREQVAGKVVIDATNPFAQDDQGHHFWTDNLGLLVQTAAPEAQVVKAFNAVGNELMLSPPAGEPAMFICGDSDAAKATVTGLLTSVGWAVSDVGGIRLAGAVEALALLWVRHGVTSGRWNHIVSLVRT